MNENGVSWCIERAAESPNSLPTASTCYYLLRVPPYKSEKEMRERFAVALKHGTVGYTQT
jgi:hypothetical protein